MMTLQTRRVAFVVLATLAVSFVAVCLAEPAAQPAGRFQFDDMVQTGRSELGGEKVGVHVPGIVNLKVDRRPNLQGARLNLSVLSGLVNVNLDRVHHPDGTREGPIDVRVFGVPVYRNQAAREGTPPKEPSASPMSDMTNSLPTMA